MRCSWCTGDACAQGTLCTGDGPRCAQGTVPCVSPSAPSFKVTSVENGVSVSTGFSLELPNFSFDYNLVPESMAALLPAALVAMVCLLVAFA